MSRSRLEWVLLQRAKLTYPYPPNPFCNNTVSLDLVERVLVEAGYKDFKLHLALNGVMIEPRTPKE